MMDSAQSIIKRKPHTRLNPEHTEEELTELKDKITAALTVVKQGLRASLLAAKDAGKWLNKAKSAVKHGQWQKWLRKNFCLSTSTAQNYMLINKGWKHIRPKKGKKDDEKRFMTITEAVKIIRRHLKKMKVQPADQTEGTVKQPNLSADQASLPVRNAISQGTADCGVTSPASPDSNTDPHNVSTVSGSRVAGEETVPALMNTFASNDLLSTTTAAQRDREEVRIQEGGPTTDETGTDEGSEFWQKVAHPRIRCMEGSLESSFASSLKRVLSPQSENERVLVKDIMAVWLQKHN